MSESRTVPTKPPKALMREALPEDDPRQPSAEAREAWHAFVEERDALLAWLGEGSYPMDDDNPNEVIAVDYVPDGKKATHRRYYGGGDVITKGDDGKVSAPTSG
jgi:hypothetical protein